MSAPRGRGLVMTVLKNFRDSFNVIKGGSSFVGTRNARLVGEDPFGNKYYEIPANPRYCRVTGRPQSCPLTLSSFRDETPMVYDT